MASIFKNGVKVPKLGSVNRRVWDISWQVPETKTTKLRQEVLKRCAAEGIKISTASVEHCVWRRFVGLVNHSKKVVKHEK